MPAALAVGEELCPTHSDSAFAAVRNALGVPNDFLCSFDWASLRAGGGKGGQLLAFHAHADRSYVVKELSPSDHATLLGLAGPYSVHVASASGSLLAPLYAHFRRQDSGVDYVVMGSVLPPPMAEVVAAAPPCLYDLKGTADDKTLVYEGEKVLDVHKRFYNVGLRICDFLSKRCHCCGRAAASAADLWAPGRREYAQGKKHAREVTFSVTPLSYAWLLDRLEVRARAAFTPLVGAGSVSAERLHPPRPNAPIQARPDDVLHCAAGGRVLPAPAWTNGLLDARSNTPHPASRVHFSGRATGGGGGAHGSQDRGRGEGV